jgi:hypothetical protein
VEHGARVDREGETMRMAPQVVKKRNRVLVGNSDGSLACAAGSARSTPTPLLRVLTIRHLGAVYRGPVERKHALDVQLALTAALAKPTRGSPYADMRTNAPPSHKRHGQGVIAVSGQRILRWLAPCIVSGAERQRARPKESAWRTASDGTASHPGSRR